MKKILLTIIVLLVLGSCRSSRYMMPNDMFRRNSNGYEHKWYEHQKRGIIKTIHHPRWANNYKR